MFHLIKNAPELSRAITSTYLYDIVIAVFFVLVMVVVANLIKWQPGKNERSGATRRVWFFVIMALVLAACLVFDYFAWFKQIAVPAFAAKYTLAMVIASLVATIVYFGLGFLLVKLARIGTKLQSIFPKKDR